MHAKKTIGTAQNVDQQTPKRTVLREGFSGIAT